MDLKTCKLGRSGTTTHAIRPGALWPLCGQPKRLGSRTHSIGTDLTKVTCTRCAARVANLTTEG